MMTLFASCRQAGLDIPTSIAVEAGGVVYVAESGLPCGGAWPGGRIWRLGPDGSRELLLDPLRPPVTGLALDEDALLVSEGGLPCPDRPARQGRRSSTL